MSLFAVIAAVGILSMAGLVYDGSEKTRTTHQANLAALETARAASQGLSGDAIEGAQASIDPARGAAAARQYLSTNGLEGTVNVSGQVVTVTVSKTWAPTFTPFVKGGAVTGVASATSEQVSPS